MFALHFVLVLAVSCGVDFLWTRYTIEVTNRRAVRAALCSAGIAAFGAIGVISYIDDRRLLPAAVIGYFIGTWIAVIREKRSAP